jgi:hypothetical protein
MYPHLTDSADTGEIVNHTQLDLARTEVISLTGPGETTQNMAPYMDRMRPVRLADATGEYPALREMPYGWTPAEDAGLTLWGLDDLERPPTGSPPPPPAPPKPTESMWSGPPVGAPPFPTPPKPGRGRHRAPAPLWARLSVDAGLYLLGVLTGAAAVLAWVVTQ